MNFTRYQPCNDCPYRKDAPLQKWSVEEFKRLVEMDGDQFGSTYGCHKKDDHVCVGWLIDQDRRFFPSISLRFHLAKNNITREYLDRLKSPSELYTSIKEMCIANYPKFFKPLAKYLWPSRKKQNT